MDTTPAAPFRLRLPPSLRDDLLAHARAALPAECCGFLAGTISGRVGTASEVLPLVNELASPTAFRTEPRSVLAAFRRLRATGAVVLAVYHSHPSSAAVPSRADVAGNTYGPHVAWVIVGMAGEAPDVRAWWLDETSFRAVEWA